MIAVCWAVILSFAIGSYTQIQNHPVVKLIPFALAGAVVGTHERWLHACGAIVRLLQPAPNQNRGGREQRVWIEHNL
jgi:hypothetical protein